MRFFRWVKINENLVLSKNLHYNKNVSKKKTNNQINSLRYQIIGEPTKRSSNGPIHGTLNLPFIVFIRLFPTGSTALVDRIDRKIILAQQSRQKGSWNDGKEQRRNREGKKRVSRGRFDSPIELPSRARTLVSCEWSRRWPSSLSSFWRTVADRSPQARIEAKILV